MSKGRILVVDDDRLVLATVVHGLAQAGYDVIDADNGDDAILLAREHRPDLALLDIRMDGKSGFDVAEYLREALHIPFMFLSAFADDATVQQVRRLGAVAYLVKPLDIGQILPAVQAALDRGTAAAPAAGTPPKAGPAGVPANEETVAIAVGVLMHRHSLGRTEARSRLQRLAAEEGHAVEEQAQRLVEAFERLVRTGGT